MSDKEYSFYGFSCTWCKYKCARRNDMQKHMQTLKHKKNVEMVEQMGIMKINHTSRQTMFHDNNAKHINVPSNNMPIKAIGDKVTAHSKIEDEPLSTTVNKLEQQSENDTNEHVCICGKKYKHLSSLCKHRKKCGVYIDYEKGNTEEEMTSVPINEDNKEHSSSISDISNGVTNDNKETNTNELNSMLASLINEQSKQNVELKHILAEQGKQIIELAEKTNNVTNITTNNTVNNKFNLNVFLNNECKDAMNISDFIDSLPVNTTDLENMGNFGFVEGITRILLNGLQRLDVDKRPIHCSDIKRESIYIKDNDIWEKDTEQKDKMKKVIRYVRHKNVKKIPEWQRVNPTFSNPRTSTHMRYMNIIGNTMGGATDEEDEQLQNKIIRKVVPEVTIPKTERFKIVYSTRNEK